MNRWLDSLENALGRRWMRWLLLGLLAATYTLAYRWHPLFPGGTSAELRQGWWSWSDQFDYWKSAAALAQGKLMPGSFHYPPGYPALGALFWRLLPSDPFFLPDLALVLATALVGWRFARRFLPRWQTLGLALGFIALHAHTLGLTVVVPWNTLLTQFTLFAGILVALTTAEPRSVLLLAALAGATYLARPVDAVSFAPLLVFGTLRLGTWRSRIVRGVSGLAIVAAAVAGLGLFNQAVFGAWRTPYETASFDLIGFFSYPTTFKAHWLLVDGHSFFGEYDSALLFRYPWLFLAIPGAIFWVVRDRLPAVAGLSAMAVNVWLYFNYNDFLPSAVFRFTLIHYVSWLLLPMWLLAGAALFRGACSRPVQIGFGLAAAALITSLGLQLEERTLATFSTPGQAGPLPTARPLWIRFPDAPLTAVTDLRLDGRALHEPVDYQIPYVPADLRLLLGSHARGTTLAAVDRTPFAASPDAGDFVWGWRLTFDRLWSREESAAAAPWPQAWDPAAPQDRGNLRTSEGWFEIERNERETWRWAGRRAVLTLAPSTAGPVQAVVSFRAQVLHSCRLTATVAGQTVWTQEIKGGATLPGSFALLRIAEPVFVEFGIDRDPRVASETDRRRLGFRLLDVQVAPGL